jgi:acyl-CoA synthetase (AMP-forming)/AMP-acid ligase II
MSSANKKNAILSAWEKTLARKPASGAVFSTDGRGLRTFAEIETRARAFLENLSVFQPGSVLAIQIGNSPDWPALLLAALRRRLIPLPMGRHIEKFERHTVLETCRAAGIIEASATGEFAFRLLTPPDGPEPGCEFLKLTAGSTALPRAIRFQCEQLVADCDQICEAMGITENDLNFGVIPFSHSYGFSNLITPLLCRGVPLAASEDRMPRAILSDLARTGATVFPGMPVFYQAFGDMANLPALPRLRLCVSAGAPLSKTVAENFTKKFGLKIHSFYGASECGGIAYDASESPDYEEAFLGRPLKSVRIEPLPASLIEIRGAAVGEGYFPEADPGRLGAGRFIPPDLVDIGARGMTLSGSVSDVINIAGRKLNPREVEARLLSLPGVKEAVVFAVPSPLRNEEAVACVTGPAELSGLFQHALSALSAWQMPRDIWLVDSIPSSAPGKIDRREIARRYLEFKGSRKAREAGLP